MTQARKFFSGFLLLLAACGGSDDLDEPVVLTGQPVALDERLLLISGGSRKGFLLDVVSPKPKAAATVVELPFGALLAVRRQGEHDEALVVCSGRRDSAEERAEPSTLAVIESDGDVQKYLLGATPFDTIVQSNDGRYAVLYRTNDKGGRTLQNVNELVVVDLDRLPSDDAAVTSKTPDGLAHAFESAVISKALPIAGEMRQLLVLLSAAEITLFDLNHIDRRGTIVELGEGEGRMPQPKQVLFGDNEPVMYVRGDNANDVFVFRLEARSGAADWNDFRPTLNPLGAGNAPRDMVLFGAPSAPEVFVVGRDAQARSIDPRSGKTLVVTLSGPADHIRKFDGVSPTDPHEKTRALVYGDNSQNLMFVDVESLRERPDRSLESLQIAQPVTSVIEMADRPNALILTHAQGITLLDLEQRSATPIAANGQLEGALYDAETHRLWVATKSDTWVGTLDLASGETGEIRLDATVHNLVPFFNAGKLAIVHPSQLGYVTVLDAREPSRDNAQSLRGFFVNGILDRGE